jgi:hypothetical protein
MEYKILCGAYITDYKFFVGKVPNSVLDVTYLLFVQLDLLIMYPLFDSSV